MRSMSFTPPYVTNAGDLISYAIESGIGYMLELSLISETGARVRLAQEEMTEFRDMTSWLFTTHIEAGRFFHEMRDLSPDEIKQRGSRDIPADLYRGRCPQRLSHREN